MTDITDFPIRVPQVELDDLSDRLARTRWPDEGMSGGGQGVPSSELRALVGHWRTRYDWRLAEAAINAMGSSRAQLGEGIGIHFLHVRSRHDGALPLLLCHGWPGSILEFRYLVGPLTNPEAHGGDANDAFHVVIPSMPGFGFSDAPSDTGWGVARIAEAWVTLMQALGYGDRFGVQGGDWGSAVVEAISRMRPQGLVGAHVNLPLVFPTAEEIESANDDEREMLADARRYYDELAAYADLQATRPQTLGYSLSDSPAGQAAWILQLFRDVSDSDGDPVGVLGPDEILDDVMLYWLPNSGASSARLYWEAARERAAARPSAERNALPFGFSVFPGEAIRASQRWIERRYSNVVFYDRPSRGGHFAALENPEAMTHALRTTFAALR